MQPDNALIARLLVVFGEPSFSPAPEQFLQEYVRLVARFATEAQKIAGDKLIRDAGDRWPTPKECVQACVDAEEEIAARNSSANAPRKKYPWEQNAEAAMQWSSEFMAVSELAKEARAYGWSDKLRGYARSFARSTLNASKPLPPAASWMPPKDVLADYRKNRI